MPVLVVLITIIVLEGSLPVLDFTVHLLLFLLAHRKQAFDLNEFDPFY